MLEIEVSCSAVEGKDRICCLDDKKLPAIYAELRKNIFVGEPMHEYCDANQRGSCTVIHSYGHAAATYGWQLFRTPQGTAMLEHFGQAPFFPSNWTHRVSFNDELPSLRDLKITFHQSEAAFEKAKEIVERQRILALERFEKGK